MVAHSAQGLIETVAFGWLVGWLDGRSVALCTYRDADGVWEFFIDIIADDQRLNRQKAIVSQLIINNFMCNRCMQ